MYLLKLCNFLKNYRFIAVYFGLFYARYCFCNVVFLFSIIALCVEKRVIVRKREYNDNNDTRVTVDDLLFFASVIVITWNVYYC